MLKCIIVDDELKSRESLKSILLTFCEDVEVSALCQDIVEGLKAIDEHQPDIVFLDIQMKQETGFDLLTKVSKINFDIIFTTAHSEYAIKAIRFSAIDYLLKPIDIQDLQNAVENVRKKKNGDMSDRLQQLLQNLKGTSDENHKLALPTSVGLTFIKIVDILYCRASGNYTDIYMKDGKKHLVSRLLKEYDELLCEHNFYRIHHSSLINLNFVQNYIKGDGGSVVMVDNITLDVSRRKKDIFLERIGYKS